MGKSYVRVLARIALLIVLFQAQLSMGFIRTYTSDGKAIRWQRRVLSLAGNSNNSSGLSFADVFNSATLGLGRWKDASGGAANFDYWQGTDGGVYEPNNEFNGLSSLYFASSNSNSRSILNRNVIGLTQVWFDVSNGEILESDTVLNDLDFRFTMNQADTTQGSGGGWGNTPVYIQNVLTHELGHAFGLSHSAVLQSTMLFVEGREQAKLSCDDQAGIREVYPGGKPSGGTITGSVRTSSNSPVFGAHVLAISVLRGVVLASAITGSNGSYEIKDLEPGDYSLFVEPYYAGANALPDYYRSINNQVCSGRNFGRTFANISSLELKRISISDGGRVDAPTIQVSCSSGAAVPGSPGGGSAWGSGPVIGDASGFSVFDRAQANGSLYYRWNHPGGRVDLHALGFSIYSPVKATIDLLDAGGSPVTATRVAPSYDSASGYRNWDSLLTSDNLPAGTYTVVVSSAYVSSGSYPAGSMALDMTPFFVITGATNRAVAMDRFPANPRCTPQDPLLNYHSPSDTPRRYSTSNDEEEDKKGGFLGFCGRIQPGSPPPSGGELVGWFLPFLLLGAWARLRKLRILG